MATVDVVVGRQPIFDVELAVIGYELLRPGTTRSSGGAVDASSLLYDSVSVGINRLVGDKTIFCDVDRAVLLDGAPVVLPVGHTVFEIDASLVVDDEVLAGCEALVTQGFMLALDHATTPMIDGRLAQLVSVVKVERALGTSDALGELLHRCGEPAPQLVALGVETYEELEQSAKAGFSYFQGELLSRPQAVTAKVLGGSSGGRLKLAARLASSECSAAELEDVIRGEPSMAYQLLQMASVGTNHGMRREVRSIREALVLLGWQRIQSWLSFLLATQSGVTTEEEVVTTLTRARMCELLAEQVCPAKTDLAFTAGMISAFDRLLDVRLDEVLESVAAAGELREAVLGGETPVGRIVADVIGCQGGAAELPLSGVSGVALHAASIAALGWALDVVRSTGGVPGREHTRGGVVRRL